MKQCTICGTMADDREAYCRYCGADIAHLPPAAPAQPNGFPGPYGQPAPPQAAQQHAPVPPQSSMPPQAPPPPQMMQAPPPSWYPVPFHRQRPFSWADICTVLGFASSIIGYFWAGILLLPLGLVTSVVGFRGDRTRGLAVAGIVISAIGLLIKLVFILYEVTWLPDWFTNGVW